MDKNGKIFGILNVTEDSFSDAGKFLDFTKSKKWINYLIKSGANVIDVGAQSSNLHSKKISSYLEWRRLKPIIEYLKQKKIPISLDTFNPKIIEYGFRKNVEFINNINGFQALDSLNILKNYKTSNTKIICMFSSSNSEKAQIKSNLAVDNVLMKIYDFFDHTKEKILKTGFKEENIILDPGMGFFLSPDPMVSFEVIKKVKLLVKKYKQIFVSVSKKSFIGNYLELKVSERAFTSAYLEAYLVQNGVKYIRTHEPKNLKQILQLQNILKN